MENGLFDLQVNGYGGADFNGPDLTQEALHAACDRLLADGTAGVLATFTTEHIDTMCNRMAALAEMRERDGLVRQVIAGIHVEGPFINETEGYRGAHPVDAVIPADADVMHRLLDAAAGLVRLVTLAPERDKGLKVTRMIARANIVASAGHTAATLDELRAAIDAGLSMFTHVGNGCPNVLPRHDNIIQRALSLRGRLWLCFMADGVHVPFFALANYLRAAGLEKTCVVTDAVTPAGQGPGLYRHGRFEIRVRPGDAARYADSDQLIGGAISLKQAARNLVDHAGLTEDEARQLTSANPRRAMGLTAD